MCHVNAGAWRPAAQVRTGSVVPFSGTGIWPPSNSTPEIAILRAVAHPTAGLENPQHNEGGFARIALAERTATVHRCGSHEERI